LLLFLASVLTAAEVTTKKQPAKSLLTTPPSPHKKEQNALKTLKTNESKPEKRGASHGEDENLGPFKDGTGVGQAGVKTEVAHHSPIVTQKVVHVHVPVPHPYPVEYFKHVPYPVKVPVPVIIHKPLPIPVPIPYHVTVDKKVPVPVVRHVPYHVTTAVEVLDKVPVEVPVSEQYILPVSETIHKPEVHKEIQHEKFVPIYQISIPETHYYDKTPHIPETRLSETYKVITPEETYKHLTLSQTHQYQTAPEHRQSNVPETYHHEAQSPALSSHEFNIFGDLQAGFTATGYLNPGHGAGPEAGRVFSYQSLKTR
jgi:hypothetical protein